MVGHRMNAEQHDLHPDPLLHPDPITGEPGAHPIGTGIGAAALGVAAGATGGILAGPVGAAIGGVAGAIVGGLAGKATAEEMDPTEEAEAAYWRENHQSRPYANGDDFETYAPAYRYGWETRANYQNQSFADVEPELHKNWDQSENSSRLSWPRARLAVSDVWDHLDRRV